MRGGIAALSCVRDGPGARLMGHAADEYGGAATRSEPRPGRARTCSAPARAAGSRLRQLACRAESRGQIRRMPEWRHAAILPAALRRLTSLDGVRCDAGRAVLKRRTDSFTEVLL